MSTALVLSLLLHALLLSLAFSGQGFGLPGLDFPWRERRFAAGDLHISLVPTQGTATAPALIAPSIPLMQTGMAKPAPIPVPAETLVSTPPPTNGTEIISPVAVPAPSAIASERPETPVNATFTPSVPVPETAAPTSERSPMVAISHPREPRDTDQTQVDSEVKERALTLATVELAKQEALQQAARQEADRQAVALLETERAEAARQATIRQEAEQLEATRVDAERQETARQAAARQEAAKAEAERLSATRQATIRQESERLEAAGQEAARQEKERQVAARAEQEAKREERLKAIGRQLDEEAARRDARPSATNLASSSTARRARLFGRTDPNAELILYAEAWARKIELNMTIDMVREAAKQRHSNPLVTVALRSDGSVESVAFVVSSGVAEIDEAIRRIVQSQAPYPAFQPALAREYDVIEIRRNWSFDMAVRLF